MAARVAVENPYFRLTVDDATRVVTLVRTAEPFTSLDPIADAFVEVDRASAALGPGWSLLLDAREAPARNDPQFEEAFGRVRKPIMVRFGRIAVLVKSAAGRLQVQRYTREDGLGQANVFHDEAAALAYLTDGSRPR